MRSSCEPASPLPQPLHLLIIAIIIHHYPVCCRYLRLYVVVLDYNCPVLVSIIQQMIGVQLTPTLRISRVPRHAHRLFPQPFSRQQFF